MRVLVVGGGLAGLTAAAALARCQALHVTVVDKGRQLGGRLASRRVPVRLPDGSTALAAFDHGAPAVTAASAPFAAYLAHAARLWHAAALPDATGFNTAAAAVAAAAGSAASGVAECPPHVGIPTMAGLVVPLTHGVSTLHSGIQVTALHHRPPAQTHRPPDHHQHEQHHGHLPSPKWTVETQPSSAAAPPSAAAAASALAGDAFDIVVLALPPAQSRQLLAPQLPGVAEELAPAAMQPRWTGLYAFAEPLPVAGDMLRFGPPDGPQSLLSMSNEAAKGAGRQGGRLQCWVVQAADAYSQQHLEEPEADMAARLLAEAEQAAALAGHNRGTSPWPQPVYAAAHRWRYGLTAAALGRGDALYKPGVGLGICGDWLRGSSAEDAFLSGAALARAIITHHNLEPSESGSNN